MQLSQVGEENEHHLMLANHKGKRNGKAFLQGTYGCLSFWLSLPEGAAQSLLNSQKRWASLPDAQ